LEVRTVPGDHSSILTSPHVDSLAWEIAASLEGQERGVLAGAAG